MGDDRTIRIAQSCAVEPRVAAEELRRGLALPDLSLVLFFCSSAYDRQALAGEIRSGFRGVPLVVGCTTAGEIGPLGCHDGSVSGVGFARSAGTAVAGHLDDLGTFDRSRGVAFARELRRRLEDEAPQADAHNTFAFLLVDGLFGHEEQLAHALQEGLGDIPLVGGSAGDSMSFASTYIYRDGEFVSRSAVLVLITTPLPFMEFKTQHFEPTDERLVVTEADPAERVVSEINGLPAAEEYARMLGVDPCDLGPAHFAASPVVVLIDGNNYVRSILKVNADGSLKFYCAIERGVVLRVARGVDLVRNLETAFAQVRARIGPPQAVLAFDCILRKLEITQTGVEGPVAELMRTNNAVGFNTYGEQYCGIHMNQTLTAVAIGSRRAAGGVNRG
jgi:hypothetical protein